MPRRTKEAAVEVDVEALIAEVAALKKEVAALKSAVSKRSSGGSADPRVDVLIEALTMKSHTAVARLISEKLK